MDATAGWEKLTSPVHAGGYGVTSSRVIIYGQSIGSGPSTYLASTPALGGSAAALILHSGVMSLIRVILPLERTLFVDPFPNIERIPKVNIPVAIIHGDQDEMVPFQHGQALHAAAPVKLPPLWLRGAGHNDVPMFPEYYQYLSTTVKSLAEGGGVSGARGGGGGGTVAAAGGPTPSEMRR